MTRQEAFDIAVAGLLQQGKKSYSKTDDKCYYRYNGMKCAIGFLIPDHRYDKILERRSLSYVLQHGVGFQYTTTADYEFYKNLQNSHDEAWNPEFVESFKMRAKALANQYNLIWKFE